MRSVLPGGWGQGQTKSNLIFVDIENKIMIKIRLLLFGLSYYMLTIKSRALNCQNSREINCSEKT